MLNNNPVSAPFQDRYTELYNRFAGEGQPRLHAYTNEYGGTSYGTDGSVDGESALSNNSTVTPTTTPTQSAAASSLRAPSASDMMFQREANPDAFNNNRMDGGAGGGPGVGEGSGMGEGTAGAGEAGGASGVGGAGSATGDGDAGGNAGDGSAGNGSGSGPGSGGEGAGDGQAEGGITDTKRMARASKMKMAEGGMVPPMEPEGLMEPPGASPPGESEDPMSEIMGLVQQLKTGGMDPATFAQQVVAIVEPAAPADPMAGGMPTMEEGPGLMQPPSGPMMAQGGMADTATPQPTIPPDQQVQGTVVDPAVDTSDTVSVPTDTGGTAKLTSKEFVFPSDAATFIGHQKLMSMVEKARAEMGQTVPQVGEGGKPAPVKQGPPPSPQGGGPGLMSPPSASGPAKPADQPMSTTGLLSVPQGMNDRLGMVN